MNGTDSTKKLGRDSAAAVVGGALAVALNNALGNPVGDEAATAIGVAVALYAWRLVRGYVKDLYRKVQ